MVHFISCFVIGLVLVGNAWSKCESSEVLPLKVDGKESCYKQKTALRIQAEKIKDYEYVDFEITTLEAEFENVPEASVRHYVNVDYDLDNKPADIQIMSFVCSGETPVGADAIGDSLLDLSTTKEESPNIDVFIATGQAADNLQISQAKKAKVKVYDRFLELYESRTEGDIAFEGRDSRIFIPSILSSLPTNSNERRLYSSFFSKTNSSINACSKKFAETMKDHLLENVVNEEIFHGVEFKRKYFSSKVKMKWKL